MHSVSASITKGLACAIDWLLSVTPVTAGFHLTPMFCSVRGLLHTVSATIVLPCRSYKSVISTSLPPNPSGREAGALRLLLTLERVQLDLSSLQNAIRKEFFAEVDGNIAVVDSNLLKKIMRRFKLSIAVADKSAGPPLFVLTSEFVKQPQVAGKYAANLGKNEKSKLIRIGTNIDDHMLSVRVKQAEALIRSGCVVFIVLKFAKNNLARFSPTTLCDGKKVPSKEDSTSEPRTIDINRFISAFDAIPGASVRRLDTSQGAEVTLLLRPLAEPNSNGRTQL